MLRITCLFVFAAAAGASAGAAEPIAIGDWPSHARDAAATRFSPLVQIARVNVGKLERAWTYHTRELESEAAWRGQYVIQCTPLIVDGVMYVLTPLSRALALDAATGAEIWSFDPKSDSAGAARGMALWTGGGERRLFMPVRDGRLYCLDPATGKADARFGKEGFVNLRELYPEAARDMVISSPPMIHGEIVIQGFSMSDGIAPLKRAPLTAFDARTGKVLWTFDTVPQEGEFGFETWGNGAARGRGGANVWSTMSLDAEAGILYAPATSATFDFYGGDRPGANLFSNCVVALDAATGKRLWHFQTTHHDLWDYDLPAAPVLVDLNIGGRKVAAVAQVGKTGMLYLLDRKTGEPVFEIEERPVPASDVPGEAASPTQPFPTRPPPFTTHGLTEANLSRLTPETYEYLLGEFRKYRSEGIFTPPSLRGTIEFPGFHGGANWSGAAIDPRTGRLYVNSTEIACIIMLVEDENAPLGYRHTGWPRFRDKEGYPANAPPWGQLSCIDLAAGEILWQKPLGEFNELTARGVPVTGQENFGGATATAGGLIFIASTMDARLRAFDSDTGEILFTAQLDAAGYAAPVSYMTEGRQYIAICAGGGGKLGTPKGDSIIAFALPAEKNTTNHEDTKSTK